jgi:hypothetical protein
MALKYLCNFQVSDDYIGLDVLSTQSDVMVSNFRKINIKGFPVYGMAQPARHVCIGLHSILSLYKILRYINRFMYLHKYSYAYKIKYLFQSNFNTCYANFFFNIEFEFYIHIYM